jgi:hypothetical protein
LVAEEEVGRDGVVSEILEVVGTELGEETDATAFLAEIDDGATSGDSVRLGLGNEPDGLVELFTAIAAHASDCFACEAFGMDADERRWYASAGASRRRGRRFRWSVGRWGESADVSAASDPVHVGFFGVPYGVERARPDGLSEWGMVSVELCGVDDEGEVFLCIARVVVEVEEGCAVGCWDACACHTCYGEGRCELKADAAGSLTGDISEAFAVGRGIAVVVSWE